MQQRHFDARFSASGRPLALKLRVCARLGTYESALVRTLIGICGLHVDRNLHRDGYETDVTIEGDIDAQDIALAAATLCPRALEFLDVRPAWQGGIIGLMQLVLLLHIDHTLTKRLLV